MSNENRKWVSTNYGPESGVTVGPFSGLEVYALVGSMILGFLVLVLLTSKFDWPIMSGVVVAGMCPALTALILLSLVVNKPVTYLKDYIQWSFIKRRKEALLKIKSHENFNEEQ